MNTTTVKKTGTKTKVPLTNPIGIGDTISYNAFYKVEKIKSSTEIVVIDESNQKINISGKELLKELNSANSYHTTLSISRTEIIEVFRNNARIAMSVNFNTKVDKTEVIKQIQDLYPNKGAITTKVNFDKAIKTAITEALDGKERTMIGRHYSSIDEFGRYSFVDMNLTKDDTKDYDTRTRKVDPRTINWIIVNGIKYEVK